MATLNPRDVSDSLAENTDFDWTKAESNPAYLVFSGSVWKLTAEARKPKLDNTWRLTLSNMDNGDEYAVGPVESQNVPAEVSALVAEHI